ncbi:quinone oxidoreductase family protein [Streptomyces bottropensis]|uniref:quinone oxidoreductase family protein n=1 Tax=Streptomyces bottropensis TaxID=42235 RepID=UPI00369D9DC7
MAVSRPGTFPFSGRTRDGKVGHLNDRMSDNEVLRMKAVGFTEFGGPEVLQVLELPVPDAGPGEVRIRVSAATVNPVDALQRSGPARSPDARPQFVPGMEAAGVVDQIGAGTDTDLSVGDQVMAFVLADGSRGAYAEQVVVPAESVVRAPHGVSDAQAASLPMNGLKPLGNDGEADGGRATQCVRKPGGQTQVGTVVGSDQRDGQQQAGPCRGGRSEDLARRGGGSGHPVTRFPSAEAQDASRQQMHLSRSELDSKFPGVEE